MEIYGYSKPGGIGSNICKVYYDKVNAICKDGCPFDIECQPFFESLREIAKCLKDGSK